MRREELSAHRRAVSTRIPAWLYAGWLAVTAALLAACGDSTPREPPSATPVLTIETKDSSAGIVVSLPSLASIARVDAATTDYAYTLAITNDQTVPLCAARVTVSTVSTGATLIDASIAFGDVDAGATVLGGDRFLLRLRDSPQPAHIHLTVAARGAGSACYPKADERG
jgi:hypothetical protein